MNGYEAVNSCEVEIGIKAKDKPVCAHWYSVWLLFIKGWSAFGWLLA